MKPHLPLPRLVLFSLSVVSFLGLAPVVSALAVIPPTARHDQKSLQAISNNVHASDGVNTASGIKTLPDNLIIAPAVIKPGHMDIPLAVSSPSTKSILKTFVVSTAKATKNFPSTLYNFVTATHPERHPHLARRAGAKRDLNEEDPKLSEAVDHAATFLVDAGKALLSFVRDLKHAAEDGHVKRDLNGMNEVNEVNEMNEMNKDDAKLKEPIEKAAEIIEVIGDFVLHAFLEVLKAFKMF